MRFLALLVLFAVPLNAQTGTQTLEQSCGLNKVMACPVPVTDIINVHLTDGHRTWYQPLPVPHRTAEKAFWLSTLISAGVTVADVENSMYALRRLGTSEANGLFGSHPRRGVYYGIAAPACALNVLFSYHYKREDDALRAAGLPGHKCAKWWLPSALNTGAHVVGVAVTLGSTGR